MKKVIPFAVAIVLIVIIGAIWVLPELKEKYEYSNEVKDLNEYYEIYSKTEVPIMLQNDLIDDRAYIKNGTVYASRELIAKYFTNRFYYNETEQVLLYSTPDMVITVHTEEGNNNYYVDDTVNNTDYEIAFVQDETLYIALDYVKRYADFSYELFADPYRIQVYTEWGTTTVATVNKNTQVRTLGGVKCPILEQVSAGDTVTVLNQMETWTEVKTQDAVKGYVETKYLDHIQEVEQEPVTDALSIEYPDLGKDYTVAMAWQYIGGVSANDNLSQLVSLASGLNVVSPTWFYLNDNAGNFLDLGSSGYVSTAHNLGLEVWALIEDITYDVNLTELLSSSENRQTLIDNLMNAVDRYGLDGINIDFEGVNNESAQHFLQFLRELSIRTHAAGIVLSIDNYMPNAGNRCYDYNEQGIIADYVILMGYDEHWAGCADPGSVASIGFVKNGIQAALNLGVPSDKLINAIPFYTRVWETTGATVKDTTDSMVNAEKWAASKGVTLNWDEETCQYYGELVSGDTTYQIWMEEEESIQTKLNVMLAYNLGGVAAWQLGYEKSDVWPLIQGYVNTNVIQAE